MKERSPVSAVFLTVFIDMLGVGIIIPVLPSLFLSPDTSILPPETSHFDRSVLYGYLTAIYPAMQFFGAPILGALSDRYGRKPMLQISLLGTLIGYLLFGWAIVTQNLPLLFISRALPGFTGGNISIVMSALSDIATPENRTQYFGLIGMAFGLGFILGPAIGGVLSDNTVISWFDHATPFWFTAGLTVLNMILVKVNFPETNINRRHTAVGIWSGFKNLNKAFRSQNLRAIFGVSLFLSLGFSFFTQFFSVYMIQQFDASEKQIGIVFGWVGIWLAITQGLTARKLATKYHPMQILRWSIFLLSISVLATLAPQQLWMMYFVNPFIATFQGLTAPNLTTMVSVQASAEEQGEILGINQSMVSVGQFVPAIIAGYLNSMNGAYPIIAGALFIFIGWMIFMALFKPAPKAA
jgi:DHA1 family tetracycline resistance protein-like MFS transporter